MAYTKRFPGGFLDKPTLTTPIDSAFLNAVETALLELLSTDGSVDGQALQWIQASSKFGPALLLNKNIDAAAAIDWTKINTAGKITNADVSGAAAIDKSKLNLTGGIVNADISNVAAIALSKLSMGGAASQYVGGDGLLHTGSYEVIDDLTVSGLALASYDTNTRLGGVLPTGYKALRVIIQTRSDAAVTDTTLSVRFNNDSGANYDWAIGRLRSVYAQSAANGATAGQVASITGSNDTVGAAGSIEILIPNYNANTFRKEAQATYGARFAADGVSTYEPGVGGFEWRPTVPITRLTLFPTSGNFMIASRILLLGMN